LYRGDTRRLRSYSTDNPLFEFWDDIWLIEAGAEGEPDLVCKYIWVPNLVPRDKPGRWRNQSGAVLLMSSSSNDAATGSV
jgi:hypothetical protein